MSMKMPRTKGAGIVRRHLADIEKELREGVALADIHSALREEYGLELSFNGFKTALRRARKERNEGRLITPPEKTVLPASEPREKKPGQESREAQESPRQPEAKRKKRGIISPDDFRPRQGIEEELEKLARKKYE
ncbi:MAG: hypothetical protein ACQEXI_16415 [Pseudomonadota bacterium]